ncbi:MAG: SDR family oxidoreductase, partial [Alphaproteobacteria bacterium]|nr:SDR family oxidoreductase [Alphaproteobacteria bacterium]
EETFDLIFAVNVKSIYWSAIHALPEMRKRGGGAIVNTSSTAAISPRAGLVWYNGSKGAVNTITKGMAMELAPDRIRVNAVCPVAGETQMLAEFAGGEVTEEKRQMFLNTIPLGRFSQPLDIANATLFLASDEADLLTGVCLEVDGGRCI